VVEHSPHHPKVPGSNPAPDYGREKMAKMFLMELCNKAFYVSNLQMFEIS
jgi:hypothetical protein